MGKDNEQQERDSGCNTAACYAYLIKYWDEKGVTSEQGIKGLG